MAVLSFRATMNPRRTGVQPDRATLAKPVESRRDDRDGVALGSGHDG